MISQQCKTTMLIDIISHAAEQQLLALVERNNQHNITCGSLYFQSTKLQIKPSEEDVVLTIRPVLEDRHAAIYFFDDGDMVITWSGVQKSVCDTLCARLYERYNHGIDDKLHAYYDLQVHGEEMRIICKRKMANRAPSSENLPDLTSLMLLKLPFSLRPSAEKIMLFHTAVRGRIHRKSPEILVVEDQLFSRKLLLGMLAPAYKTYAAANAEDALALYFVHAPDIVFLDVELPGISGHQLAALIHQLDAQSHIIMVTANNHVEDVIHAKENSARGFIVKPYSKQKILDSIEKYLHERK